MNRYLSKSFALAGLIAVGTSSAGAQSPGEYVQDFRTGNGPESIWKVFGPEAQKLMRPERGGLRIKIPASRKRLDPIGMSSRVTLSGDFEVSMIFDILAADEPKTGYGAGVNILLQLHTDPPTTAKIAHYIRSDQGSVLFLDYKVGKKEKYEAKSFPTSTKKGRLALKREGTSLFFMAGPSGGESLELYKTEVGREDVPLVRFVANTGGSPSALDVRFVEVRIRSSDKLLGAPRVPEGGSGLWWVLCGSLLVGGGMTFWWWQRRHQ
jgi:hypothetical protein